VSAVWPVILLGVAGLLLGGVLQMRKQGASLYAVGFVALLALVAAAGGVLWLIPSSHS
jgi:hypothetical protein